MKKNRKVIYIADRQETREVLLERVFRQHEPALRRFLHSRLVLEADCEDIAQELFAKLLALDNLAEKLSETSGNTLSYLFSIATNLIVDHKRRIVARRVDQHDIYEDDLLADEQAQQTPEMIVASEQQLDAMMRLLKKLKPKCRQAFVLSRFKHKSYPEIAQQMGLSVPSVERYITIALAALRKGLK